MSEFWNGKRPHLVILDDMMDAKKKAVPVVEPFTIASSPKVIKIHKQAKQKEVIVSDMPLNKVTSFEPGDKTRLGVITTGWFIILMQGIKFKRSFCLELPSASDEIHLILDTQAIGNARTWLPDVPRAQFNRYLADCAYQYNLIICKQESLLIKMKDITTVLHGIYF